MTIYTNTPYTYRIGWSKTGMNYYGVRYAKDCHPSDLFVTYFTSSTYVADYIKKHGNPDIIEVRKIFTGEDKNTLARIFETRVLCRIKAKERDDYLNKHHNTAYDHSNPEIEEKRRQSIIVTKNTPECKEKVSGINWWRTDKTIYDWEHGDGTKLSCTRVELVSRYGLRAEKVTEIVNGTNHRKSHGGWRLAGTKAGIDGAARSGSNNHGFDHTQYSFIHDSGISERCTRYHLYTTYDLDPHKIMLLIRGDRNHHKGWRLAV